MYKYFLQICFILVILPNIVFAQIITYDYNKSIALGTSFTASKGEAPTINTKLANVFEASDYQKIKSSDDSPASYETNKQNNYASQRFVLEIKESASSISQIDINWDGYGKQVKNNGKLKYGSILYIWDYANGNYENIGNNNSNSYSEIKKIISSDITHYISDKNTITLLAMAKEKSNGNNKESQINTDYISINITPTPLKISNAAYKCGEAEKVTIIFSDPVDEASAENIANYKVKKPSGRFIDVRQATRDPNNKNWVLLELKTALNDMTSYTVYVENVISTNTAPLAPDSSYTFSLSCGLNCITDEFSTGTLDLEKWSVSHSSGSFGSPRIVTSGRLRLTDASNNVATVSTILRQYPGAGNKIELEFDYYAYGKTTDEGADGVVVTFSDATITPQAGGYGGSLGYAQRTREDGFAGGWLGVGIDEFGNFANPTEGRNGGVGFKRDSVSLRGSGKGKKGYKFLKTSYPLTPGIDGNHGKVHRYKITIDNTMSETTTRREAYISIARDTGRGYIDIIRTFNIYKENPGQADVPANWVVSLTGATGGSTNIHEVADFKVCAAVPIVPFHFLDHYEIIHNSKGLTCDNETVTVRACRNKTCSELIDKNVDLALMGKSNAAEDPSKLTIATFKGSTTATAQFNHSTAESITLSLDNQNDVVCKNSIGGPATSCEIVFSDTGFRFFAKKTGQTTEEDIPTQLSGKPSDTGYNGAQLYLQQVEKDPDTGICKAIDVKNSKIEFAAQCITPTDCIAGQKVKINDSEMSPTNNTDALSYSEVALDFTATTDHSAPFVFTYPDAGMVQLHARYNIPVDGTPSADYIQGNSNNVVVRPFGLYIEAEGNPEASDASGAIYKKAGEEFTTKLTAKQWKLGDDSDNDGIPKNNAAIKTNIETPNFQLSEIPLTVDTIAPIIAPINPVLLGVSSIDFANKDKGIHKIENQTISEVGIFTLTATPPAYLTKTMPVATSDNIGRFTPDHFTLSIGSQGTLSSAPFPFVYNGQLKAPGVGQISYLSTDTPKFTITAQSANDDTTKNYTGNFVKLDATNIYNFISGNNAAPTAAPLTLTSNLIEGTLNDNSNGTLTYTFNNNDNYVYSRDALTTPFTAAIDLQIEGFEDTDTILGNDLTLTPTSALEVRFGRWTMENSYGPETVPLRIPMQLQYWDGNNFINNNSDSYTEFDINATNPILNYITLADGTSSAIAGFNYYFADGKNQQLSLSAPTGGKRGSVKVTFDVPPWLQFDWNNIGSYTENPSALATFGLYRDNDRIIYRHEVFK